MSSQTVGPIGSAVGVSATAASESYAQQVLGFYRAADARMQDLPLYNPSLTVELVGWQPLLPLLAEPETAFRSVADSLTEPERQTKKPEQAGHSPVLAVLITPWCINLWVGFGDCFHPDSPNQQGQVSGSPAGLTLGSLWALALKGNQSEHPQESSNIYELTLAHDAELGWYASGSLTSDTAPFAYPSQARAWAEDVLALVVPPVSEASAAAVLEGPAQHPRNVEATSTLSRRDLLSGWFRSRPNTEAARVESSVVDSVAKTER